MATEGRVCWVVCVDRTGYYEQDIVCFFTKDRAERYIDDVVCGEWDEDLFGPMPDDRDERCEVFVNGTPENGYCGNEDTRFVLQQTIAWEGDPPNA